MHGICWSCSTTASTSWRRARSWWAAPDGSVEWSPEAAVVVAGAIRSQGDASCGCCPVLNFFASGANAERWLAERPDVPGASISLWEAAAAGRAIFGDVLPVT